MSFQPRTYEEILSQMIAHVQYTTVLSDFTVGSVIRTILESAALEDDEQYFQMVQLLDAFSVINATGEELDGRLADYNVFRRGATKATGYVVFANNNIITDQAAEEHPAGALMVKVFDSTKFPLSFPYSIRVGEGTTRTQDLIVNGNNTFAGVLTIINPLTNSISVGDRVSYFDITASPINTPLGTQVQAPASVGNPARIFSTEETASILPGNYYSNEVLVRAATTGTSSNVSAGRISQFMGALPYPGALVTNRKPSGGGLAVESDKDFRQRGLKQIQSLSRGTVLSLLTASINIEDVNTGKRVVFSNIIEDFDNDEVNLYIDDGTGLTASFQSLAQDNLSVASIVGTTVLTVNDASNFPSNGYVFLELDSAANPPELVPYTSVSGNDIHLTQGCVFPHNEGTIINFVEVVSFATEAGEKRFKLGHFPVVRSTDKMFMNNGTGWTRLGVGDYILNRGTGEFQLTNGAIVGTQLVIGYDYYTNLIAVVQKVLEGDSTDFVRFPGFKAAGIRLNVEAPVLRRITVRAQISADRGYAETDLYPLVRDGIATYIQTLGIGDDVILSEIVHAVQEVAGVRDVIITAPTSNITILENELPVSYNSSGNTLIQVI